VLQRYPQARGAIQILSFSPRPFSAGSLVETPLGPVFVKRHHRSVRNEVGMMEEHHFLNWLSRRTNLVKAPFANENGHTVTCLAEWTYEVHPIAIGVDTYQDALSWTPFQGTHHARAAGRALAELHLASAGYDAPSRAPGQLISSVSILASENAVEGIETWLASRPQLSEYLERRRWRNAVIEWIQPTFEKLRPLVKSLPPLWTHNDLHASNLTWSSGSSSASVTGIIDFGLADRTNAVHDLATAIERNIVEWLRISEPGAKLVHFDHLEALLAGYLDVRQLSYSEAQALTAMLPIVHIEFALSEADYFLSILHSEEKTRIAWEGYFIDHARWFRSPQGLNLLQFLEEWAAKHLSPQEVEATR